MKKTTIQLFKQSFFTVLVLSVTIACSKDKEGSCNVTTDDYVGTYYGEYGFSVGGAKIADTIIVSKGTGDNALDIYSSVMKSNISGTTNCEKFSINTFTGVKFSLDWAEVFDGTGSGNGQFDKSAGKLKVAIKFSSITADLNLGTGPAEYKNMVDLTGDFVKR